MRVRDIIGLAIALLFALGIAIVSRMFLLDDSEGGNQTVKTVVQKAQTLDVLIAAVPLQVGARLALADVRWQPWPETSLNAGYITKGEIKLEDLEGGVVRYPVSQGEPLTLDDVVRPGDRSVLSAIIDSGRRGVSINVNAATASSGLIRPGDYVDVIVSKTSASTDGVSNISTSEVVVTNVRVLAIDKTMGAAGEDASKTPKTATLELTPSQAEILVKATQEGQLFLSLHGLRTAEDDDQCPGGICQQDVGMNHSVKVIRGSAIENVTLKAVDDKATGSKS